MDGHDAYPVRIGDALVRVCSELGLPAPDAAGVLAARWAEVVGVDVAAHVRLSTVRDGTAVLTADSSLWASQLRYLQTEIVDRANALVGAGVVRAVRVRVQPS